MTIAIGEPRYTATISQYLINMTMLSGFIGVSPIDGAYWSLFLEIRFYGLVAIVLLINRIHQAEIFIVIWLIASFALSIWSISKLHYLLIVDYSAYFIAGATYFLIWSQGLSISRIIVIVSSWLLAMFLSISRLKYFESHYNVFMNNYIVGSIITAFFVVMLLISLQRTGFIGRSRWQIAGVLTYPLYLLHQNIGYMIFNLAYPMINSHILFWGTIVIALLSAYSVHLLIEKPFSPFMKAALKVLIK